LIIWPVFKHFKPCWRGISF